MPIQKSDGVSAFICISFGRLPSPFLAKIVASYRWNAKPPIGTFMQPLVFLFWFRLSSFWTDALSYRKIKSSHMRQTKICTYILPLSSCSSEAIIYILARINAISQQKCCLSIVSLMLKARMHTSNSQLRDKQLIFKILIRSFDNSSEKNRAKTCDERIVNADGIIYDQIVELLHLST